MATGDTLDRQWRLIRMLNVRRMGVSIREAAEELETSQKTIRRDLQRLLEAGIPLDETDEAHGRKRWRLTRPIGEGANLTFEEAAALMLAAGQLTSLLGSPLWRSGQSAIAKLRAGLPESVLEYLERLRGRLHQTLPRQTDYSAQTEIIETLQIASEDSRWVFLTYQSRRSTEPVTIEAAPYALCWHGSSLYVVGDSRDHGETRVWKVDRVTEVEATEFRFRRPADFSPENYFSSAFGIWAGEPSESITLRFAPAASRAVAESKWHPSQQLEPQSDGSLLAHFEMSLTPDLIGWLLAFGPDAQVIHPPALADQITTQLETTLANYRSPSTAIPAARKSAKADSIATARRTASR